MQRISFYVYSITELSSLTVLEFVVGFVVRNLKFVEFLVFEENRVIVRDYEVDCYTGAGKLSSLTNFPVH